MTAGTAAARNAVAAKASRSASRSNARAGTGGSHELQDLLGHRRAADQPAGILRLTNDDVARGVYCRDGKTEIGHIRHILVSRIAEISARHLAAAFK